MNDFAERVEGAGLRLADQHREISALAAAMAENGLGGHETPGASRDAHANFNETAQSFADHVADLETGSVHEIEQSVQELAGLAHACADRVEAKWQVLNEALVELRDRVGALPQVLDARLGALKGHLQTHAAQLDAANGEATQAIATAVSSLGGLIRQQFDTSRETLSGQVETFSDDVDQQLGPRLQRMSEEAGKTAADSLDAFAKAGNEAWSALQHTMENALSAVDDELQRAVDESFPQLQRELVEDATDALAKEVIEGIATSTIGAEVSTAMSPYLVELIAIKKILEALLEAIRLFKTMSTAGGLLG